MATGLVNAHELNGVRATILSLPNTDSNTDTDTDTDAAWGPAGPREEPLEATLRSERDDRCFVETDSGRCVKVKVSVLRTTPPVHAYYPHISRPPGADKGGVKVHTTQYADLAGGSGGGMRWHGEGEGGGGGGGGLVRIVGLTKQAELNGQEAKVLSRAAEVLGEGGGGGVDDPASDRLQVESIYIHICLYIYMSIYICLYIYMFTHSHTHG